MDSNILSKSGAFVNKIREIEIYEFYLSKYLVTNMEYRKFIEDDGYINQDYWIDPIAKGWLTGDEKIINDIKNHWLLTLHEHHRKEMRDGEIDESSIEEEAIRRTSPRQVPFYWDEPRFNQDNQPVVGINYWEATAYCIWATKIGHELKGLNKKKIFSVPTEFEWERASKENNDERMYPWGNEWDEDKAHVSTNTLNIREPSPVGIYLESWENGPFDMAGNVWEWTASLKYSYDKKYDKKRFNIGSFKERIVRGSSWYNCSVVSACSSRALDRGYNLFYDVGFRMIKIDKDIERL